MKSTPKDWTGNAYSTYAALGASNHTDVERGLVQTVYGIIEEGPDMHTYDYSLTYSENSRLSLLYEYLADIGYEISDEEKALLDGTSELYSV